MCSRHSPAPTDDVASGSPAAASTGRWPTRPPAGPAPLHARQPRPPGPRRAATPLQVVLRLGRRRAGMTPLPATPLAVCGGRGTGAHPKGRGRESGAPLPRRLRCVPVGEGTRAHPKGRGRGGVGACHAACGVRREGDGSTPQGAWQRVRRSSATPLAVCPGGRGDKSTPQGAWQRRRRRLPRCLRCGRREGGQEHTPRGVAEEASAPATLLAVCAAGKEARAHPEGRGRGALVAEVWMAGGSAGGREKRAAMLRRPLRLACPCPTSIFC